MNFFKPSLWSKELARRTEEPADVGTLTPELPKRKAPRTEEERLIAEIHAAFNTASESLIEEANTILGKATSDKGKRLAKLGFAATKEAKEHTHVEKVRVMSAQVAEHVKYYESKYPGYKFITHARAIEAAKKYDLVLGYASDFTGYVPEENVREMEALEFDVSDAPLEQTVAFAFDGERKMANPDHLPRAGKVKSGYVSGSYGLWNNIVTAFRIVAPPKDFKSYAEGRTSIKDGQIEYPAPKDPIVLCPVGGGYLVVTAWGPEAEEVAR